jgi:23S rRNA (uracil1939-C5)-methyltransferase
VPVHDCLVAPEGLVPLAGRLLEELDRASPAGRPWPRELALRASESEGRALVVLQGPGGAWPEAEEVARRFVSDDARLAGVLRVVERRGAPPESLRLAGASRVTERLGGAEVEVGATTFLQVNPGAAERLYEEAARALAPAFEEKEGALRILDLFCGAGLAGLRATPSGHELLGVERSHAAVRAARQAARRARRPRARFVAEDALRFARRAAARGERFDALLANPPRAGAGADLGPLAQQLGVQRAVLVSCHPATLARDAAGFVEAGFRPAGVVAVDLFPQTTHLESVLALEALP